MLTYLGKELERISVFQSELHRIRSWDARKRPENASKEKKTITLYFRRDF